LPKNESINDQFTMPQSIHKKNSDLEDEFRKN